MPKKWILTVTGTAAELNSQLVQPRYKYTIRITSIDRVHEASKDIRARLSMQRFPEVIKVLLRVPGYVPNSGTKFNGKFSITSVDISTPLQRTKVKAKN